jgi:hypothetical protein
MPQLINIQGYGVVSFPDDMTKEQIANAIENEKLPEQKPFRPDYTPSEALGHAWERGKMQFSSAFGDVLPAALGSALGFEDYAKRQMGEAAETQRMIQAQHPAEVQSYKEIEGPTSFGTYALETAGEQALNLLSSLGPGVAGRIGAGVLAKRGLMEAAEKAAAEAGLTGEAAQIYAANKLKEAAPEIAKQQMIGQNLGIYLGSYAQNYPELFQNVYEATGKLEPGAAALYSSVSAGLDSAFPAYVFKKLAGPADKQLKMSIAEKILEKSGMKPGILRSATSALGEGMAMEGLTESAQEGISIAAERFIADHPEVFGSKEWDRIIESGLRGSIAGGIFGAPAGAVEGIRGKGETKEEPAPPPPELGDLSSATVLPGAPPPPPPMGAKKIPSEQQAIEKWNSMSDIKFDQLANEDKYAVIDAMRKGKLDEKLVEEIQFKPPIQEMRTENGLPVTGARTADTTRIGEPIQISGRPGEQRVPGGPEENIQPGIAGAPTDVTEPDGRKRPQPSALAGKPEDSLKFFKGAEPETINQAARGYMTRRNRVLMPIDQFLALAKEDDVDPDKLKNAREIIAKGGQFEDRNFLGIPELFFSTSGKNPTVAKVTGHEGRHRALALKEAGYTHMPVDVEGDIRWSEQSDPSSRDYEENHPLHLVNQDGNWAMPFPFDREGNQRDIALPITPQESRAAAPTTGETSESLIGHLVKEFGNNIRNAIKRGVLSIVNDVKDLPSEIQAKIGASTVGAYHKGRSYIIANRVSKDTARRTLLHEIGEHHGLEGMLGKDIYKQVLRQVKQLNKMDPVVTAAHDHVTKMYPELQPNSDAYLREVLARIGETAPQNSIWRRVVAAVKTFLTKAGLYNPNNMTTADIQDMILHSLRTTLKQKEVAAPAAALQAKKDLNQYDVQESRSLVESVGETIRSTPVYNSKLGREVRNVYSTIPDKLRALSMSFLSLPQMEELFGTELPALRKILDTINRRGNALEQLREKVEHMVFDGVDILKKYPKPIVDKFNDIAHKLTANRIDPRTAKEGQENYDPELIRAWNNLDKPLRDLAYKYSNQYAEYRKKMIDQVERRAGKSIADQLRTRFENEKISFYLPLRRKGNYRLSYNDKNGERIVVHRESPAEIADEQRKAADAGGKNFESSLITREVNYKDTPPIGFVKNIIDLLDNQIVVNNDDPVQRESKERLINEVYKSYLDLFPDESLRQQMRTREGVEGYIKDVVGGFADVGSKLANQLSNLEFRPELDEHYKELRDQEAAYRQNNPDYNKNRVISQVAQNMYDQKKFLDNPVADNLSSNLGWFSYMWHIAGNVSSALINLTQVPMVVVPMLSGKYGWGATFKALTNAYGTYRKGGYDTNRRFMPDFTFGAGLKPGDKYYKLYHAAVSQSALRRNVGYELTEMRRSTADEFTGTRAKIETGLGWIFGNSERLNREVTLIAAYDLGIEKGLSPDQAIKEAIDITVRSHSHALSEAGPKMFQTGLGKVAFTFKRFAQTQIYNVARLFHQAFQGVDKPTRLLAQKQLAGIMGMTYMFSGAQGLPLYGAANMFMSACEAMFGDDDEPYDFDEQVRSAIGDLGYKGPLNKLTNLDIASRTGFNGMVWHTDDRRLSEVGFAPYVAEHFFGPAYQALLVNPERAMDQFNQGQSMKALETMTPSFVKNPLKAFRFATEGALTSSGAKIVDDVSAMSSFMQIFGFSNAELSEAYARANSMKKAEQLIQARRTSILDLYYLAKNAGDEKMLAEIEAKRLDFNESHPSYSISRDTLRRSYIGKEERVKNSVDGVYLNKKLKAQLMEEYGD